MRVFALSDIHLDYDVNVRWLSGLSESDYRDDVLVLAGDVSDSRQLLEQCFKILTSRFKRVLYLPGNHDLWVFRSKIKETSFEKYDFIREMAKGFDVSMETFHSGRLSIVPLLGWYDYSFGQPSSELRDIWMDYRACAWPDNFNAPKITRYFADQNEHAVETTSNDIIISFSHFLPRIDLIPSYVPASTKVLFPVLGSTLLEKQIRRLNSAIHIYGHSHLNQRVVLEGISYINNALGYPTETRISRKNMVSVFEC